MSALKIKYTQIFIDNTFVDSVSGRKFPVVNPSNGQVITQVAEGDTADIDEAVTAARRAFDRKSEWRKLDASQRGVLMNKLADLIERDRVFLSQIEALDSGKTVEFADADITYTIGTLRYYAGWTDKIHGNTIPADGHVFSMTLKEPVGVCGQIIPWNYPLLMLGWKFGPALATGCTIILKPAEQTPLSALHVAALSVEAGFPPGVINVVPGYGPTAGAALSSHNDVDKIAFTGSTQVGKIVMTAAAQSNLKRVTLELGGKSPLVVFDDADVDMAAETAANAIFANHGQNCCAGSRTYVHANIYDEFVTKATTRANAIKVGDPFDKTVHQGPQIDEDQMKSILSFIDSGKSEGARLCAGGNRIGTEGFFVEPTVFADVQDNMTIAKQEIFGPVQCILKFNTFDEVVERANATLYGLAAGIITKDINRAIAFAKQAKAGSLWVNTWDAISGQTPFGGYKQSGFGRELGQDGLDGYLETKTVTIGLQS